MSIPDFQTLMLPLLQIAIDGKVHFLHDAIVLLAEKFKLNDEEITQLLPSGQQPAFSTV